MLDFDVADGKPGLHQLAKLIESGVIEPGRFVAVGTPSGGRHLYFKGSAQRNKQNEKTIPGVDFRGSGGMVLAAGNPGYDVIILGEPGPIAWDAVRTALAPPPANPPAPTRHGAPPPLPAPPPATPGVKRGTLVPPAKRVFDDPIGQESPLDWYSRNVSIEDMLLDAGWTFVQEDEAGRRHFRRPGKRDGVSGNIAPMPDGRLVFYSFTSSAAMPTDTGLSGAQLYAWLEHGGSQAAASSYIRRHLMPRGRVAPPVPLAIPPANSDGPAGTDAPPVGASPERGLVPIETTFWQERGYLRDIRWLARERRVSPWAMLGSVLALATCRIGPHVVLPPIVGGVASLNMLVGLVGPSGKGKGAAWAVALEYLAVSGFAVEEVGTPQGIDATFTEPSPKAGPVQFNDVAFFYVPEIDSVKAHSEMTGSALIPHLRKVWSGEALGAKYAAKDRRRPVRAHSYRASAVVGIQPARSGVLLNDADGGLPQRFLWLPVHDPHLLRRSDRIQPPLYAGNPPSIEFDVWLPEGEQRGDKDEPEPVQMKTRYEVPVCLQAQNEIIDAREENLASEYGGLDSHALLTQAKVALGLAFLDRRMEIGEDDWRLARILMKVSDQTRAVCERALAEAERDENVKRGRGRAVARMHEQIAETVIRDERAARVHELGSKLLDAMQKEPGREFSPRELQQWMDAKSRREYWEDVRAALAATPGVVEGPEITAGGKRIRKLRWTASS